MNRLARAADLHPGAYVFDREHAVLYEVTERRARKRHPWRCEDCPHDWTEQEEARRHAERHGHTVVKRTAEAVVEEVCLARADQALNLPGAWMPVDLIATFELARAVPQPVVAARLA